jgi:hypothetical protein
MAVKDARCVRSEAVERSEILDGHRSGGYVHLGGSEQS